MNNVKLVLTCILALGASYAQAKENDGVVNLQDYPLFLDQISKLPSAVLAAPAAVEEYKSATHEQRDELVQWVRATFEIPHEQTEQKIEAAIEILIKLGILFG